MSILKVPVLGWVLRFIYRVGEWVEGFFIMFFTALLAFLALLTRGVIMGVRFFYPPRLFERICRLGAFLERWAVRAGKGFMKFLVAVSRSLVHDLSYWAAGLAGLGAAAMVLTLCFYTPALKLTVNGEEIATVSNETVFTDAVGKVEQDLSGVLGENYAMESMFNSSFCVVRRDALTKQDDLYHSVYTVITGEIGDSYGLYVDGKLVGANERKETLDALLDELKAPYVTGAENETAEFVKPVKIRRGLYPASQMKTPEDFRALFSGAANPLYYTIEEDDYIEDIEKKTGVDEDTLYALNPDLDDTRLIPGQKLLISRPDVYIGVRVTRESTYTEEIGYSTTRIEDSSMYSGETKVKTEGKNGERTVTARFTYVDGVKQSKEILSSVVTKEPVTRELYVGTKARSYSSSGGSSSGSGAGTVSANIGSGDFIRPINGGYTSCAFWGYYGHTGVDLTMHGAYGQPVYASAGGTVIYARSSGGGYGKLIKIQHAGGIQTYYAHLSSIGVSEGQTVSQGQYIGNIGASGNAYGAHLHFELRINGTAVNPMRYIG